MSAEIEAAGLTAPHGYYRCEMCKQVFPWGDPAAAAAEFHRDFGVLPAADCVNVCDACYQRIRPDTHPKEYTAYLAANPIVSEKVGTNLVDIGYHKYGLFHMRFSRCTDCGTEYPHTTGVTLLYGGYDQTPGPMCNGKPILACGCRVSQEPAHA